MMNSEVMFNTCLKVSVSFIFCVFLFHSNTLSSQILFNENFNGYADGVMSGSNMGVNWNISCPTCEGYYEIRSGRVEQNNSNGTVGANIIPSFSTSPINISNCSTITLTMDYAGQPYPGSMNFESAAECTDPPGCAGDPNDPEAGDCYDCWDFFLVELVYNDGTREQARFIGSGTDLPTTAAINYSSSCLGSKSNARIEVRTQTWASAETNTMDNVMIVCNPGEDDVVIEPIPVTSGPIFCEGESMTFGTNATGNHEWFDPNGTSIGTQSTLTTTSSTSFPVDGLGRQTYTVVVTDAFGCKTTGSRNVIISEPPVADMNAVETNLCEGNDIDLSEVGPDGTMWSWNGPAVPNPGDNDTWTISNAIVTNSGTYTVTVTDANGCTDTDQVTINVSPSGTYTMPDLGTVCPNDGMLDLGTEVDGIMGNWSGTGVTGNMFDPTGQNGSFTLTFKPTDTGCLATQNTDITVSSSPDAFSLGSALEECGVMATTFDLSAVEDVINGGTGLSVEWYSDMDLTMQISNNHSSGSATIYAVVNDGSCTSDAVPVELIVTPGPEILMPDTVLACVNYQLPMITGNGLTPNIAYFNEPGGNGTSYQPGETFTLMDTVLYIYDDAGSCADEHEFTILIGTPRNAGADIAIDTCVDGFFDLFSIKDPTANTGLWIQSNGDTIEDGLLLTLGLEGATLDITYYIPPDHNCPDDFAEYSVTFQEFTSAGRDSFATICLGESIDIANLTEDGGISGMFFLEGASNPVSTVINTNATDQPFNRRYLYVTESGNACPPDTAFLLVDGVVADTTFVDGIFCRDYEVDVQGTLYNIMNPSGTEIDPMASSCTQTISINLEFHPENVVVRDDVLCEGQSISVNGTTYDELNPSGTEMILGGDQYGCDSIVNIDLTFDTEVTTVIDDTYCIDDEININGTDYNVLNTTGSAEFVTASGCDSIVVVDLTFEEPETIIIDGVFCPGDSVVVGGETFNFLNPLGLVELPNVEPNLCDTIVTVSMEFDMGLTRTIDDAWCIGREIMVNGSTYNYLNPSGIETILVADGCDSLININLTFLPLDSIELTPNFCSDTSIVVNGTTYNMANRTGEEVIVGGAPNGCNQHIFIDLNFEESVEVQIGDLICRDSIVVINGISYSEDSPSGMQALVSSNGCDSILNINYSFTGISADLEPINPQCSAFNNGLVIIDIVAGADEIMDVLLDGASVLDQYLSNDTLFNIDFGFHEIEILGSNGCDFSATFQLEMISEVDFAISSSVSEQGYNLGINYEGELESIVWSPSESLSCTNCPNPIAVPEENTTYFVEAIGVDGCTFRDSINLDFIFVDTYFRPNVFSPNEDGVNDIFVIRGREDVPFSNFEIFDRWGNRVFNIRNGITGDEAFGWDGRKDGNAVEQGVYIYYMTLDLAEGQRTIMGDLSLIR